MSWETALPAVPALPTMPALPAVPALPTMPAVRQEERTVGCLVEPGAPGLDSLTDLYGCGLPRFGLLHTDRGLEGRRITLTHPDPQKELCHV